MSRKRNLSTTVPEPAFVGADPPSQDTLEARPPSAPVRLSKALIPSDHPSTPPDHIRALARLVARGEDLEEALTSLDLTNEDINGWLHHPSWMQLVKESLVPAEDLETKIRSLAPEALRVKERLLRNSMTDAKTRNAIADDILDRAGLRSSEAREKTIFVVSPDVVANFLSSMKLKAIDAKVIVDE